MMCCLVFVMCVMWLSKACVMCLSCVMICVIDLVFVCVCHDKYVMWVSCRCCVCHGVFVMCCQARLVTSLTKGTTHTVGNTLSTPVVD